MKSEYMAGFMLVLTIVVVLVVVWIPFLAIGRKLQDKQLSLYDTIQSNQLKRAKVLHLLNKKDKE